MKKGLRFSLILTCLLFLMASKTAFTQLPQTIEFGPHVGLTTYQGDVNPWKFFHEFDYSLGGTVRFNYDTRWAFRADYSYGYVHASDEKAGWRPERGHAFRTRIHDMALIAEFNFMDYYTGRRESTISPYLFAGISGFSYKTGVYLQDSLQRVQFTGITPEVNLDSTRWYYRKQFNNATMASGMSLSIPFGFGCKFSLTQHLAASIEWRMHYTLTDNLDGIIREKNSQGYNEALYPSDHSHQFFIRIWSQVQKKDKQGKIHTYDHFEYDVIIEDPDAIASQGYGFYYDLTDPTGNFHEGQQRGDASTNDWFGFLNLTVTWKIPIPGNSACKILY